MVKAFDYAVDQGFEYTIYVLTPGETATVRYRGNDFATAFRVFSDLSHKAMITAGTIRVQLFHKSNVYPIMAYDPDGLAIEALR